MSLRPLRGGGASVTPALRQRLVQHLTVQSPVLDPRLDPLAVFPVVFGHFELGRTTVRVGGSSPSRPTTVTSGNVGRTRDIWA